MRWHRRAAFLFLLGLLSACSNQSKVELEQIKLHTDFIHYFQNVLDEVEIKGKGYAKIIAKNFKIIM